MPAFSLSLQLYVVDSKPPEEDVVVNQNGVLIRSKYRRAAAAAGKKSFCNQEHCCFQTHLRSLGNWQLPRDLSETNRFISCCISVHCCE